jgi:serine/threonine protein kinase
MLMEDRVKEGGSLGAYELLTRVGRGGMATVWAARRRGAHGFSRVVALKTMLPELCDDADFRRMFLTEARLASRIRHPNVLETVDLGEEDGLLYLVMEWMDGETLGAIMKSAFLHGGVPLPIALKLIIDACAGAHAAHELCDDENRPLGLVHRDVSPPNVLVSYTGVVKLADFGVAKTMEANGALTLGGHVKGRLRYMAPEQLLAGAVDRRTDLFALGITLYQLTTGRHPWPGDTAAVTVRKILYETPAPPTSVVEGYPPELERIVLKALNRNPAERFETAAEMATAIEEVARTAGAVATTRDVGAYVTELLGAHGSARRHALRKAVRAAETGGLRDTDPQPVPPQMDDVAPHSYSRPPSLILTGRRFPKWPWAVAAGLTLATGTYLLARHGSSDGPAAAPPVATASMSPAELPILACTAAPASAPTSPAEVDDPTDPSPRTNDVRRAVPPPSKRTFVAPKRGHRQATSEPDVGF